MGRIDRRPVYAEIRGEAGNEQPLELALAQVALEPGLGLPIGFLEAGIGIDHLMVAFADHHLGVGQFDIGGELGAVRVPDAVVRPQHLRAIGQLHHLEGRGARMSRGERDMARRMPVLGHRDVLESPAEPVDRDDDLIAAGHGKLAAGEKIILQVDHEEEVVGTGREGHAGLVYLTGR